MSNKLKRRKAQKRRIRAQSQGAKGIHVKTYGGSFMGRPVGDKGWMILEMFTLRPGIRHYEAMHVTSCHTTGETFVKPFLGEYRLLDDQEVDLLLKKKEEEFKALGGEVLVDSNTMPNWLKLEHLQATIDYELDPPCGCEPVPVPISA